jgi:hypothetical protein
MDAFDDTRLAATLDADVRRFGKTKPTGKTHVIQCRQLSRNPRSTWAASAEATRPVAVLAEPSQIHQ